MGKDPKPKIISENDKEAVYDNIFHQQINEFSQQNRDILYKEQDIFSLIYNMEKRHDFIIKKAKENINSKINEINKRNKEFYDYIMEKQKNILQKEIENVKLDINKSILEYETILKENLELMKEIFHKNKKELIEKILNALNINF